MKSQVSIVKCKDYQPQNLSDAVRKSIDLIGGISKFIQRQDRVLIKPNLLCAAAPQTGIDTHPEFVRQVIRLVKETGATIFVGDGPGAMGARVAVEYVYETAGIKNVCQEENVELVYFKSAVIKKGIPLADWIERANKIISLPKFKTHELMILTAAVKNLFGFVMGMHKVELHKKALGPRGMANILVDIYESVRPTLTIVDGVVAMEGDGPASAGILRNLGLVLASCDAVALDSVLAVIMGLRPQDILTNTEAFHRNLGKMHLEDIEVYGEDLANLIVADFKLPKTSVLYKIPKPVKLLGTKLIRFRPVVDLSKCTRCNTCVEHCPQKTIAMTKKGARIDYRNCINCFCCQELCPEGAISTQKSLAAKVLGL